MKKYVFLIIWLISLDTLSKLFAEQFLRDPITLFPSFFSLEYVQNPGIAFSIPLTGMFLKIITLILIFWIIWYYFKEEKQKHSRILNLSYSFVIAGALGNAWERLWRWYVTDFISVEYFSVFNLADSFISIWAIWLIYYYFTHK